MCVCMRACVLCVHGCVCLYFYQKYVLSYLGEKYDAYFVIHNSQIILFVCAINSLSGSVPFVFRL